MKPKPQNMKYTDLCIYIDKTIYERDENNNPTALRVLTPQETDTVYNYLYALIYALAVKKRLLNSKSEYDTFCLDTATSVFLRLERENQDFTYTSSRNKPIKSVLNYLKGALAFMAITWKDNNYFQTIKPDFHSVEEVRGIKDYLYNQVLDDYNKERAEAYRELLKQLPTYLEEALDKSAFKKNKLEKHQLLLSEYLTLCNSLSLEQRRNECTAKKKRKILLEQLVERKKYCILFSSNPLITKDLVELQLKRGLFLMEDEANRIKNDTTPSDEEITDILDSALPTYDSDQSGD